MYEKMVWLVLTKTENTLEIVSILAYNIYYKMKKENKIRS